MMRFEKVWIEQYKATKAIKRRFGAPNALDIASRKPAARKTLRQLLYLR
jgi:hypothetical protein